MIAACRTITIDHVAVRLRPTLRAAINLDRQFGGLHKIAHAVADGGLTAATAIIRECHDVPGLEAKVFAAGLASLIDPLLDHLIELAGGANDKPRQNAKSIPLREWYEQLFKIGTGWLGWTAQQTLDTAPCDIAAAYEGRLDLIQSIFGGGKSDPKSSMSLDEKWGVAMGVLGTRKVQRAA